jgi:hypothetical protein
MKTAVGWLVEKFMTENTTKEGWHEIFEQAKSMEKEQRQEDTNYGYSQGWDDGSQNVEPMRPEVRQQHDMKIDQEDFNRKAEHIIETVVKPQVERYERAKAIEEAAANIADPNVDKTENWIAGAKWMQEQKVEDPIVLSVMAKYYERSQVGIKKYGTMLNREDLTTVEWLTHLQEELMDATLYIERLKQEYEKL